MTEYLVNGPVVAWICLMALALNVVTLGVVIRLNCAIDNWFKAMLGQAPPPLPGINYKVKERNDAPVDNLFDDLMSGNVENLPPLKDSEIGREDYLIRRAEDYLSERLLRDKAVEFNG